MNQTTPDPVAEIAAGVNFFRRITTIAVVTLVLIGGGGGAYWHKKAGEAAYAACIGQAFSPDLDAYQAAMDAC